jgi:hypothetical protein
LWKTLHLLNIFFAGIQHDYWIFHHFYEHFQLPSHQDPQLFKTSLIGDLGFIPSLGLDLETMKSQVLKIRVNL